MPGVTLESVWRSLSELGKLLISQQLHELFLDLRELPFTTGLLGAVSGPVCTDHRRGTRMTTKPTRTIDEFDEFRFSNPLFGSPVYLKFLQQISKSHQPTRVVFTHGDVRTANILVEKGCDGTYTISGVIDWETSGFYPEDFECSKITTTMRPQEKDD
jgi:aminoglycoside phosphotransferase (APT) family kinase protein